MPRMELCKKQDSRLILLMSLTLPECQWFFYLVRKGLIYLVQLPSVIFMEMSEQQSVEANGNKDDYSESSETPHWQTAFIFHHCKSEFKEKQGSTQSSGLSRTTILSEGQLHLEIFKHIR